MTFAEAVAPYRAIFDSRAREELQYRAAALAGLFTQVVFGFIMLMVLLEFYASSDVASPLSATATAAYIWLGQALLGFQPWTFDRKAVNAIRTGDVVQELLQPVDLYRMWYARTLAWRLIRTGLRFVPMVAIAAGVFPLVGLGGYAMPLPASAAALGLFVLAVALSALLTTAITLLLQVVMLWTVSPDGVMRIVPGLSIFFSGGLIPLPLFPQWLQPLMRIQPLRGLIDTPSRVYTADLVGPEATAALLWSAFWIVALVALGRWGLRRGMRRTEIAGG